MTFAWPQSLSALRDYLEKRGVKHDRFSTARQAAFFAQQVSGSRIKFPAQGADVMPTLLAIQKSLLVGMERRPTSRSCQPPLAAPVGKRKRLREGSAAKSISNSLCECHSGYHLFCDGACEPNPGSGGWGVVVYKDVREIATLSGGLSETTNNVMELTGMLQAVQWVIDHFMKDQPATIWCDSMYVVNGCNTWRHNWKRNGWNKRKPNSPKRDEGEIKNLDLWKEIDAALNKCSDLTIAWVKGHNGTLGNERADELSLIGRTEAMEAAGFTDADDLNSLDREYRAIMGAM